MPTHGSLTKAGKVRGQTPRIDGVPKKNHNPRKRNRINFKKRILASQEEVFTRSRRF